MGLFLRLGAVNFTESEELQAPEDLAVAETSGSSVSLTWSRAEGASGYLVEWSTDEEFSNKQYRIVGDVAGVTITGLASNTTFYFQVKSTVGTLTTSEPSDSVSASTVLTFDSYFDYTSSVDASGNFIYTKVKEINANTRFSFNKITAAIGLPCNMEIRKSSTLEAIVSFPSDYIGRNFSFKDRSGVLHYATFTNGTINL